MIGDSIDAIKVCTFRLKEEQNQTVSETNYNKIYTSSITSLHFTLESTLVSSAYNCP